MTSRSVLAPLRALVLAGVASIALAACSSTKVAELDQPDFSNLNQSEKSLTVAELGAAYKKNPRDRATIVYYAAALRSANQANQAIAVLEAGMDAHPGDPTIRVSYAKALTAGGRFEQALEVLDDTIRPEVPDWNALSVKGAVLDQMGRNAEARAIYTQALLIAPDEASLEANLGLSYAMTNDLQAAEMHLAKAVRMRNSSSQIRQNLALVVGLQGRFDESRTMFSAELTPDQVEANMTYIRSLLTQQNRWEAIENDIGVGGPLLDAQ